MKKKYKVVLSTTALAAITTVGLSTVVACGSTKTESKAPNDSKAPKDPIDKVVQDDRLSKFRFDNKIYNTKVEAQKAQSKAINEKVSAELANNINKKKVYKYNGIEFLTQADLFNAYKIDHKIEKVSFIDEKNEIKDNSENKYKDIKGKLETNTSKVFTTNGKVYKTFDKAIAEYFKHSNGDGSGETFSNRMYDSKTKKFGGDKAVVGLNKPAFSGIGTKDGKVYVTNGNDKNSIIEDFYKKQVQGFTTHNKASDVAIYKQEILGAIDQFKKFYDDQADTQYTYFSFRADNQDTKITLPSGKKLTSKFYLYDSFEDESGGKKTDIKANTLKKEVIAASKLSDLKILWDILTTRTWNFKTYGTFWTGYTKRSVTFAKLPTFKPDNNWGTWGDSGVTHPWFDRYKSNNTEFNFNRRFELDGKWFETEKELLSFAKSNDALIKKAVNTAVENTKKDIAKNSDVALISFEDKTKAPKDAMPGIDKSPTPIVGDGSGNNYVNVLATSNGKLSKANTIIGKNYSKEQIDSFMKTHNSWINPINKKQTINVKNVTNDLKILKDGDAESTLTFNKNVKVGRVVQLKTQKTIQDQENVQFNKLSEEELFKKSLPQSTQVLVPSKDKYINPTTNKGFISREEFSKEIKTIISNEIDMKYIDDVLIEKTKKEAFKNVKIPKIIFNSANKKATIKQINLGNYYDIEYKIKKEGMSNDTNVTYKINSQGFTNGDELVIVVKDEDNELTRRVKVQGLKIDMIEFFKSKDTKLIKQKKTILEKVKQSGMAMLPKAKKTLAELKDAFKDYLSTDISLRDETKKQEIANKILKTKEIIDKDLFDQITTNKDSLSDLFVSELSKNGVFTGSISSDEKTVKQNIKGEINDLLDVVRVIIDHTFEFTANSIHWKPKWETPENFVTNSDSIDAAISKASNNKLEKDFLEKLKADKGNFFATKNDENESFKTSKDLMNEGQYKVYRDVVKGKPTVYHLVRSVNSRKINNTLRKNIDFSKFDEKATIDNFKIKPGGAADSFIKNVVENAKKRREAAAKDSDYYKKLGDKTLNFKELYGDKKVAKVSAPSKVDSYSGIGSILDQILPVIKPLIRGLLSTLINNFGGMIEGITGITGINNIIPAFNTVNGSLSEFIIKIENNISGMLTHVIGDTGHIVIDVEQNKDKITLNNYYSPEIRTVDKENYNKIIYRKDDIDEFWKRMEPFMDLLLEVLGSL
ncbi:hypothetical protein MYMA111404_02445 [Mycoplasma marinum]|uniref:Lipoprotein n=1 Tax=Mycoplasma marinum TaxID=1937190 RepID=A0A4R0XQP1_9MOLU|nr:hypothetical protein [Mycoplasma marinum]TCG10670.1 hypothetical protein C4B24_04265 [Mycoplasma marinum]